MTIVWLQNSPELASDQVQDLCKRLGLIEASGENLANNSLYMVIENGLWSLQLRTKPEVRLQPNYNGKSFLPDQLRRRFGSSLLRQALGSKPSSLLDACAGFGRDSVIISAFGFQVTSCERNPLVFFLLQQAIGARVGVKLLAEDARSQLIKRYWPVVYLDPMYCEVGKSQVKKTAQMLRLLVEPTPEEDCQLFRLASKRCHRLVVKRHIHAPLLDDSEPDIQYRGQSTRYDVYFFN